MFEHQPHFDALSAFMETVPEYRGMTFRSNDHVAGNQLGTTLAKTHDVDDFNRRILGFNPFCREPEIGARKGYRAIMRAGRLLQHS